MTSSLVGSEMCIRDRLMYEGQPDSSVEARGATRNFDRNNVVMSVTTALAVSYTHLTLPTICSV
eukprot:702655-Prorocentrum_lima.AAC.1